MSKNLKYLIGYGDDMDYTIYNWIVETFPPAAYTMRDEGYFDPEMFVQFQRESDATLFLLTWNNDLAL